MSKYDSITTAKDLIIEVAMHGLSTIQEDINRAADIFGRTCIEELASLANDDGLETKEDGSRWSTGKRGTQKTFYSIAFRIWHWEDATRFFNEHTNPATKDAKETAQELRKAKEEISSLTNSLNKLREQHNEQGEKYTDCGIRLHEMEQENRNLKHEIITLKSRLYDLMTAGA